MARAAEDDVKKTCLILLGGAGWDVRRRAVSVAVTAAAFGHPVVVAMSGEPLRSWVDGRFDAGAPPEALAARVGSLSAMLEEARRDLGVEVVACDTELRLVGLEPEAARPRLDAIRSLPEQWRAAAEGHVLGF
jgi:peroxiredoxin family protein